MRISSNYQSYNTNNVNTTTASSAETTSLLSNLQNVSALFSGASVSSDSTSSTSVDDIMSQMTNDPRVQMMRMKINSSEEGTQVDMEKMKTVMNTLANADLESMSLEEKQALLEDVETTMDAIHGKREDAVAVSDLSEEALTSTLQDMQSHAMKGPGGPGGPSGPPPSGSPPSGVSGVNSSSSTSEEETALTTLEALLEAIAEDEEAEEADGETSESKALQEQTFKNAIEQYFKNQNWDTTDLKAIFEA